jgi:hypothetical protein
MIVRIAEDNWNSRRGIESMGEYFVRDGQEDFVVDWPESEGGGNKKTLTWRWTAP